MLHYRSYLINLWLIIMPWYRIGDFYKSHHFPFGATHSAITNSVVFQNTTSAHLLKLGIQRDGAKKLKIQIIPAPYNKNEVQTQCLNEFSDEELLEPRNLGKPTTPDTAYLNYNRSVTIKFTPTTCQKLLAMLSRNWGDANTHDIRTELKQISNYTQACQYKHVVPASIAYASSYVNPALQRSTALVDFIMESSGNSKQLQKLLLSGEDPNQRNDHGETALYRAAITQDSKSVHLLLCYGGNPFDRENGTFQSAFEVSFEWGDSKSLDLYNYAKPEKLAAPCSKSLMKIKSIALVLDGNIPLTRIDFTNETYVFTTLKKPKQITSIEFKQLFQKFQKAFQLDEKSFGEDINSENNIIEMIYNEKRELIGFNIFELITPSKNKDYLIVHCLYTYIETEYRGNGLMDFLVYRLVAAIKHGVDNKKIGFLGGAITPNGYRLVHEFAHYPKYQPDHMHQLLDDILRKVYKSDDLKLFRNGITCFTEEKVSVKVNRKEKLDIHERFFYEYLLGIDINSTQENNRAAPILFLIENKSFYRMNEGFLKFGINFQEHTLELAKRLKHFFPNLGVAASLLKLSLFDCEQLFWNDQCVPTGTSNNAKMIRAKL